MSNDADWVEDVKRWCHGGGTAVPATAAEGADEPMTDFALGYEAAHPSLQARHWPAPTTLDTPPA